MEEKPPTGTDPEKVETVMVAVHENHKLTRNGTTIHTTKHQEREGDPIQLVRVYDITAAEKMVDDKIDKFKKKLIKAIKKL